MIDKKIEDFLQKADMNYMFCLLSKLEAGRLSQLPSYVRDKFGKKIAVVAMEHVADNDVPDYLSDIEEATIALSQSQITNEEDDESESDLKEVSETLSVLPPDPEPEPKTPLRKTMMIWIWMILTTTTTTRMTTTKTTKIR